MFRVLPVLVTSFPVFAPFLQLVHPPELLPTYCARRPYLLATHGIVGQFTLIIRFPA